ncbi:hypothetical protein CXG81DRAFT_28049 [Caulochytrium protostelioides]|uniref:Uncharacterized protein n=1 Tax=Caulochytrium protostelioides TaxID=1555241 RepID=A0A4P9X268_9FUNG|nr:hypothetical protein CXG81DRAFT_28049 [Caulochytrium protostelioides]|eukprot:RKO99183.1 hypothetical protein CXG81DRAFT_28049 [Caulochytrium protostelioides]
MALGWRRVRLDREIAAYRRQPDAQTYRAAVGQDGHGRAPFLVGTLAPYAAWMDAAPAVLTPLTPHERHGAPGLLPPTWVFIDAAAPGASQPPTTSVAAPVVVVVGSPAEQWLRGCAAQPIAAVVLTGFDVVLTTDHLPTCPSPCMSTSISTSTSPNTNTSTTATSTARPSPPADGVYLEMVAAPRRCRSPQGLTAVVARACFSPDAWHAATTPEPPAFPPIAPHGIPTLLSHPDALSPAQQAALAQHVHPVSLARPDAASVTAADARAPAAEADTVPTGAAEAGAVWRALNARLSPPPPAAVSVQGRVVRQSPILAHGDRLCFFLDLACAIAEAGDGAAALPTPAVWPRLGLGSRVTVTLCWSAAQDLAPACRPSEATPPQRPPPASSGRAPHLEAGALARALTAAARSPETRLRAIHAALAVGGTYVVTHLQTRHLMAPCAATPSGGPSSPSPAAEGGPPAIKIALLVATPSTHAYVLARPAFQTAMTSDTRPAPAPAPTLSSLSRQPLLSWALQDRTHALERSIMRRLGLVHYTGTLGRYHADTDAWSLDGGSVFVDLTGAPHLGAMRGWRPGTCLRLHQVHRDTTVYRSGDGDWATGVVLRACAVSSAEIIGVPSRDAVADSGAAPVAAGKRVGRLAPPRGPDGGDGGRPAWLTLSQHAPATDEIAIATYRAGVRLAMRTVCGPRVWDTASAPWRDALERAVWTRTSAPAPPPARPTSPGGRAPSRATTTHFLMHDRVCAFGDPALPDIVAIPMPLARLLAGHHALRAFVPRATPSVHQEGGDHDHDHDHDHDDEGQASAESVPDLGRYVVDGAPADLASDAVAGPTDDDGETAAWQYNLYDVAALLAPFPLGGASDGSTSPLSFPRPRCHGAPVCLVRLRAVALDQWVLEDGTGALPLLPVWWDPGLRQAPARQAAWWARHRHRWFRWRGGTLVAERSALHRVDPASRPGLTVARLWLRLDVTHDLVPVAAGGHDRLDGSDVSRRSPSEDRDEAQTHDGTPSPLETASETEADPMEVETEADRLDVRVRYVEDPALVGLDGATPFAGAVIHADPVVVDANMPPDRTAPYEILVPARAGVPLPPLVAGAAYRWLGLARMALDDSDGDDSDNATDAAHPYGNRCRSTRSVGATTSRPLSPPGPRPTPAARRRERYLAHAATRCRLIARPPACPADGRAPGPLAALTVSGAVAAALRPAEARRPGGPSRDPDDRLFGAVDVVARVARKSLVARRGTAPREPRPATDPADLAAHAMAQYLDRGIGTGADGAMFKVTLVDAEAATVAGAAALAPVDRIMVYIDPRHVSDPLGLVPGATGCFRAVTLRRSHDGHPYLHYTGRSRVVWQRASARPLRVAPPRHTFQSLTMPSPSSPASLLPFHGDGAPTLTPTFTSMHPLWPRRDADVMVRLRLRLHDGTGACDAEVADVAVAARLLDVPASLLVDVADHGVVHSPEALASDDDDDVDGDDDDDDGIKHAGLMTRQLWDRHRRLSIPTVALRTDVLDVLAAAPALQTSSDVDRLLKRRSEP